MPHLWLRTQQGATLLRTDRITEIVSTPTALSVRAIEQPDVLYAVLEEDQGVKAVGDGDWGREMLAAFRTAVEPMRGTGCDHEVWPIVQDGEVTWKLWPIGNDVETQRRYEDDPRRGA